MHVIGISDMQMMEKKLIKGTEEGTGERNAYSHVRTECSTMSSGLTSCHKGIVLAITQETLRKN